MRNKANPITEIMSGTLNGGDTKEVPEEEKKSEEPPTPQVEQGSSGTNPLS